MDAVVQFVRNALCTIKNFSFLSDTFLYDPKVTAKYYTFPSPLDQTTPLEIFISVTQFYAFVSVSRSGYRLLTKGGVKKLQLIQRLLNAKDKSRKDETKKSKENKTEAVSESVARRLVIESLVKEGDAAARSTFVGINVLAIGIAFFWLFANSYHVTSTDWIGGIYGLIHALTVMEVALLFLLYYMLKDGAGWIRKSFQMKAFAKKIAPSQIENITVEQYSWMVNGWSPFWTEFSNPSIGAEDKMLEKEEEAVAAQIALFLKKVDPDVSERILLESRIALFEGYREYLYLLLNFFAFYGYMASILVFYFQDEASQPSYIRAMLFYLPNAEADWLGNAVGDFAWTVEPVIILTSPLIVNSMKPKAMSKKKVD
ncbi:hypothetical protein ACHAWX_006078 [Stephanocyclus meneghinianus]